MVLVDARRERGGYQKEVCIEELDPVETQR